MSRTVPGPRKLRWNICGRSSTSTCRRGSNTSGSSMAPTGPRLRASSVSSPPCTTCRAYWPRLNLSSGTRWGPIYSESSSQTRSHNNTVVCIPLLLHHNVTWSPRPCPGCSRTRAEQRNCQENQLIDRYQEEAPKAMALPDERFDEITAVYGLPEPYRKRLRTSNGTRRLNEELRRRERVIREHPSVRPSEHPSHLSLIHISEPTRLGMISYAVFCLKKK